MTDISALSFFFRNSISSNLQPNRLMNFLKQRSISSNSKSKQKKKMKTAVWKTKEAQSQETFGVTQ